MQYTVFLDTNIYDDANYNFRGAVFSRLVDYVKEGRIGLQINSVIEGEVRENISRHVGTALRDVNKALAHRALSIFHSVPGFGLQLNRINADEWTGKVQQSFQDYLNECRVERISVNGIDLEDILVSCFRKEPPFDKGGQDAFMDAVSVASLVRAVRNSKGTIYCIVSKDEAFLEAVKMGLGQDAEMLLFEDLREFIDLMEVGKSVDVSDNTVLSAAIESAVKGTIRKMDLRLEDIDPFVLDKKITEIDEIEFEPHVIKTDKAGGTMTIALEVEAEVGIEYSYIDEDESHYDKEAEEYLYSEVTEMAEVYSVSFDMVVEADLAGKAKKQSAEVRVLEAPSYLDLLDDDCMDSEIIGEDYDDDDDDDDDDDEA